jgi:hypothetical protein
MASCYLLLLPELFNNPLASLPEITKMCYRLAILTALSKLEKCIAINWSISETFGASLNGMALGVEEVLSGRQISRKS